MALFKVSSNALVMAKMFKEEITQEQLGNWAQAGLGNATDATGQVGSALPFDDYVRTFWLSGQTAGLKVGSEETTSFKKRGWHHRDKFTTWLPKSAQRVWKREKHSGFYAGRIPLNYLLKNLRRTGNQRFLQKAWKAWNGPANVKAELTWMFEHGLEKMARKCNGESKIT